MSKAITAELSEWYHNLELPNELTEAARGPEEKALASVLATTFVCVTEATKIKPGDFDYQKEALSIINLRRHVRMKCLCGERLAKRYRFCPACGGEVVHTLRENNERRFLRIIPIHRDALNLVQEYLEQRRRFRYEGPLVFPLSRQRVWQIIERLGRRLGIKGLHPESLRHLLAARWINKGLDTRKLKLLMGYSSAVAYPSFFSFEQIREEYLKLWEP